MFGEQKNNNETDEPDPSGESASGRSEAAGSGQHGSEDDGSQDTSLDRDSQSGEEAEGEPGRLYKTGEVLAQSGISRQMLYRYIQMDLVVPAETTDTGRNLFSDSVFKQIKMIQQLNERYTLQNIREIFSHRLRQL